MLQLPAFPIIFDAVLTGIGAAQLPRGVVTDDVASGRLVSWGPFLGLAGFENRLEGHARALRATVLQWTGIPVSVGIAPTKTLAKAANRMAKQDPASGGVALLLTEATQEAALATMELTDLWGIARHMVQRLNEVGIASPLELRNADPRFVRERFSVVMSRMVYELRGVPCLGLEDVTPNRKSIMASARSGRR